MDSNEKINKHVNNYLLISVKCKNKILILVSLLSFIYIYVTNITQIYGQRFWAIKFFTVN